MVRRHDLRPYLTDWQRLPGALLRRILERNPGSEVVLCSTSDLLLGLRRQKLKQHRLQVADLLGHSLSSWDSGIRGRAIEVHTFSFSGIANPDPHLCNQPRDPDRKLWYTNRKKCTGATARKPIGSNLVHSKEMNNSWTVYHSHTQLPNLVLLFLLVASSFVNSVHFYSVIETAIAYSA